MRRLVRTGEDLPGRTGVLHRIFLFPSNSTGKPVSLEIPEPLGPRKRVQSSAQRTSDKNANGSKRVMRSGKYITGTAEPFRPGRTAGRRQPYAARTQRSQVFQQKLVDRKLEWLHCLTRRKAVAPDYATARCPCDDSPENRPDENFSNHPAALDPALNELDPSRYHLPALQKAGHGQTRRFFGSKPLGQNQ